MSIVHECPECQEPLALIEQDESAGPLPIFPTTFSDLYRCPTHGLLRLSLHDGFTSVDPAESS